MPRDDRQPNLRTAAVLVGFDCVEQTSRAQRDVLHQRRQFPDVLRKKLNALSKSFMPFG